MKDWRVTTNFGRLHRKRQCENSIICTCPHTFSPIFLPSPWFIYVYVDVWRWSSGDINVTSLFTAISHSDGTVFMQPLKCVMKCDVLQSSVNTCVQSGRHRNRERLSHFTNCTEVLHSVLQFLLPKVNSREQFLDISLDVCWRHR
jgi:hypothetical protein